MTELLFSTIRLATPLAFAVLGGLLCERSGVINIALEGFIMFGAFSAAVVAAHFHSPWAGLLGSLFFCFVLALVYGFLVIHQKMEQIIAGMGINLLIAGLIPFITKILYNSTGATPTLELSERFFIFPLIFLLLLTFLVKYVIDFTRLGLLIKFSGEHPEAVLSAGESVKKIRWVSVTTGGVLAGLGGMSLSIFLGSSYSPMMSGGRGFIALAALILGRWNVLSSVIACLIFGFLDAVQIRLQGVPVLGFLIPIQFIQIMPYVITILSLTAFGIKGRPPKKLGRPL